MARGTRRSDMKSRLTPRRLSWLGWFMGRTLQIGKVLAVIAVLLWAGLWVVNRGFLAQAGDWAGQKIAGATASMGLRITNVTVEGRDHIEAQTLKDAIGINPGDPILGVDIHALHARLTAIAWVKDVQVRRVFPDRLIIKIDERLPIAVWADAPGGMAVIDDEGVIVARRGFHDFGQLLAVEGVGAEKSAGKLIALLKGQPELAVRVTKAIRISDRRWDLAMDGGTVLRLPEDDPGYALARAAKAQGQDKVFDKGLKAIDLRQTDRIILESRPGDKTDLLLKNSNPV